MNRQTLLPDPDCLHLLHLEGDTATISIVVTTVAEETSCPKCGQCSSKVHSRYSRTPADLPWLGCAVRLRFPVSRFFCTNPDCQRKIFTERLPGVVTSSARRTIRLADLLTLVGFALGSEAGQRLTRSMGMENIYKYKMNHSRQSAQWVTLLLSICEKTQCFRAWL